MKILFRCIILFVNFVELNILNKRKYLTIRFEAEFTCFICKRCFSGFKSFIKHVTQHEEQLATDSVSEVNEIILKSKKPKLSEPSPVFQEVTNVIESSETVLRTQSILFISSALGECKPKTALLEKKILLST